MRAISAPTTIDVMVMRIVTRFTTVDEFVAAFRRFCGEGTLFIPSAQAKRIGIETGFSIRLADGTPMVRGLCVVLDSWESADNPYERPGVRLGIRSLTPESTPVFHRLLLAGGRPEQDAHTKATVEMAPLLAPERAPHSELILPANPLTAMSDESLGAFVDCMIFEDAIPDLIDSGISAPKASPLELALASAASGSMRLDGGTQRIERLVSPIARASALAEEHADTAFGSMLAEAVERIRPVEDRTVPTRMPPSMPRLTILGVAPIPRTPPRARIAILAIASPAAPNASVTEQPDASRAEPPAATTLVVRRPNAPSVWRRMGMVARGWYRRAVWARRRRAAHRS